MIHIGMDLFSVIVATFCMISVIVDIVSSFRSKMVEENHKTSWTNFAVLTCTARISAGRRAVGDVYPLFR